MSECNPTIQVKAKGTKALDLTGKDGKKISIEPKKQQSPKEQNPSITIQKQQKKNLQIKLPAKRCELSEMIQYYQSLSAPIDENEHKSKGYIILMNLAQEAKKEGSQQSPSRRWSHKYRGSSSQNSSAAELVLANSERFIPTQLRKNIGDWDATSDEAIEQNINQLYNRLTKITLEKSITETKEMIATQKIKIFAGKRLVFKARHEPDNSLLYAQFVREINDPEFEDIVIKESSQKFDDWLQNSPTSDDETAVAAGTAKFIASLIQCELQTKENGIEELSDIMDQLIRSSKPFLIEMLYSFVLNAGEAFIKSVDRGFWKKIDICMQKKDVVGRSKFLLGDVKEKIDEWVFGISYTKNQVARPGPTDANLSEVRNGYADFNDEQAVRITMKCDDFTIASMRIFPDFSSDHLKYGTFVASVLSSKSATGSLIAQYLVSSVKEYIDFGLEKDCPDIWPNTCDLLYNLVLRNILSREDFMDVRTAFPDKAEGFNYDNAFKWYIYDSQYFAEPIQIKEDASDDICDALMMPSKVDNLRLRNVPRLIAISIVRSVLSKPIVAQARSVDEIKKWKSQLETAKRALGDEFFQEVETMVNDLKLQLTVDQISSLA